MGKDGGSSSPPQVTQVQPDYEQYLAPLMSMYQGALAQNMQLISQMQQDTSSSTPPIASVLDVDWTETNDKLYSESRAETMLDSQRRKGPKDTIIPSVLLDEDESTTNSALK